MTRGLRPLLILRRGATPPAMPACERCGRAALLEQELAELRRAAEARRRELLELQREVHELRRRPAEPAAPREARAGHELLDGPSIGEIPVTDRREPRRDGPGET